MTQAFDQERQIAKRKLAARNAEVQAARNAEMQARDERMVPQTKGSSALHTVWSEALFVCLESRCVVRFLQAGASAQNFGVDPNTDEATNVSVSPTKSVYVVQ